MARLHGRDVEAEAQSAGVGDAVQAADGSGQRDGLEPHGRHVQAGHRGKTVEIIGMNPRSAAMHGRLAGQLSSH